MPSLTPTRRAAVLLLALSITLTLTACAGSGRASTDESPTVIDPQLKPGTLAYDKAVFTALLADHAKIRRTVHEIPDGVETVTESDDPAVAARLADHVAAMERRLRTDSRVRQWDPMYVAIFDHAGKIELRLTRTPKGVVVRETSNDPKVAALIKAHAVAVSGFVKHGFDASANEHPVPAGAAQPISKPDATE